MDALMPKVPKPKLPPATPTMADASLFTQASKPEGFTSLINTSSTGLLTPASTAKRSLLGGSPSATG